MSHTARDCLLVKRLFDSHTGIFLAANATIPFVHVAIQLKMSFIREDDVIKKVASSCIIHSSCDLETNDACDGPGPSIVESVVWDEDATPVPKMGWKMFADRPIC